MTRQWILVGIKPELASGEAFQFGGMEGWDAANSLPFGNGGLSYAERPSDG